MGIYIKGIDMPKDGFIKLEIHSDGLVWEEGRDWTRYENSAIQVNTPHGELKDVSKIINDIKADIAFQKAELADYKAHPEDFVELFDIKVINQIAGLIDAQVDIELASTILEAEE